MSVLNQVYYTAKRFIMDIKPFLIMLFSYVIIIWILGSAFKNAFESSDFESVKVLYLNEDAGEQGEQFLSELTSMEDIKKFITFEEVDFYKQAEKLVKDGKAEALLYLPEEFSQQVANQDESSIVNVYRSRYSGFDATIVQSVVESYVSGLNAAGAIYKMKGSLDGFQFDIGAGMEKQPLSAGKTPSAMGYYAIAMVFMMMLMGANYGTEAVSDEYHGVIGDRMRLSQLKPFAQYSGTILGTAMVQFVQAIIIILFTKFVYDVNWGDNYVLVVGIVLLFALMTSAFGGMLAMLAGERQKASTIVSTCVFVFTFLAGGFVAQDFGAGKYVSLNYYAQSAVTNVIYDGDMTVVARNIGIMCVLTIIFITVSVVKARRERA